MPLLNNLNSRKKALRWESVEHPGKAPGELNNLPWKLQPRIYAQIKGGAIYIRRNGSTVVTIIMIFPSLIINIKNHSTCCNYLKGVVVYLQDQSKFCSHCPSIHRGKKEIINHISISGQVCNKVLKNAQAKLPPPNFWSAHREKKSRDQHFSRLFFARWVVCDSMNQYQQCK